MMNEMKTGTYIRMTDNGDEICNFKFCTDLSVTQKLKFVNSVSNLLVDGENYNFIIRDLLFDFFLIDVMTEIDLTDYKESTRFVHDIEHFLEETNIVDIIKANAEFGLIEELNEAIDLNVRYKTGIHPSPINDALASLLSTLEKKINEVDLDSMMGMAQKFVGMTGELTPENVVNAYINSDVHKKNLAEIAEVKKNGIKNEIKIDEGLGEAIRSIVKESKAERDSNK